MKNHDSDQLKHGLFFQSSFRRIVVTVKYSQYHWDVHYLYRYFIVYKAFLPSVVVDGLVTVPPIDDVPWPLGQEDLNLAELLARITCHTGVWGLNPTQIIAIVPWDVQWLVSRVVPSTRKKWTCTVPVYISTPAFNKSISGMKLMTLIRGVMMSDVSPQSGPGWVQDGDLFVSFKLYVQIKFCFLFFF